MFRKLAVLLTIAVSAFAGPIVIGSGTVGLTLNPLVNQTASLTPGGTNQIIGSWVVSSQNEPEILDRLMFSINTTGEVLMESVSLWQAGEFLGSLIVIPDHTNIFGFFQHNQQIVVPQDGSIILTMTISLYTDLFSGNGLGTTSVDVPEGGLWALGTASGVSTRSVNAITGGVHQVGAGTPEPATSAMIAIGVGLLFFRIRKRFK